MTFDFSEQPDYSNEEYLPGGRGNSLHFVARFLAVFDANKRVNLVALAHYTALQHSLLAEKYDIKTKEGQVLYGFWAGFDQDGILRISSSGSESLKIPRNEELDKAFLADKVVLEKLKLLMPNIKALSSVVFSPIQY